MIGLTARVSKPITIGTQLWCDDNSGAKRVEVIGVKKRQAHHSRQPGAGIGDIVTVSVKKGKPDMIKKKETAVIIRQKRSFRRGKERVRFTDNACVLIDDKKLPKATEIKGCVAREISERYPKVVAIASSVV